MSRKGVKMSIRAYRVIKIEYAKPDTFNFSGDGKLVNFFDREYDFFKTLDEGGGLVELPVEALQRALSGVPMHEELKEALQKDIEACRGNGYVLYYCY